MRIRVSWAISLLPAVGLGLGLFLHANAPFAATPAAAPTPKGAMKATAHPLAAKGALAAKGKATPAPTPEATATPESAAAPKGPEKVTVGVYLKQLPDIDVKTNTYTMDFYLWFRWKGEIDPTKSFEFVNGIEPNNTSKVPAYTDDSGNSKPDTLPDGSLYQTYHVQGKFSHPFNLKDYPFDEQDVMVELEDAQHALGDIVYVDDKEQTAIEPHINIPGWTMSAASTTISETLYKTTFGDPRVKGDDKYSRFSFGVHLRRPIFGYMAKTILPIAIVILITFVAFLIHSAHFEARIGLVITSLISAVALQLTAANDLPSIGYLVMLDKIYNISYGVILLTLLASVISVALHDKEKDRASEMLDRVGLVVCSVLFFGGVGLMIVMR